MSYGWCLLLGMRILEIHLLYIECCLCLGRCDICRHRVYVAGNKRERQVCWQSVACEYSALLLMILDDNQKKTRQKSFLVKAHGVECQ